MTRIREIPPSVIRNIPPPVVRTIDPVTPPVTQVVPPPVTRGIQPPVINVPGVEIDYPTIDVPTEEEWREGMGGGSQPGSEFEEGRELPPSAPTINIGGNDIPLPEAAPLIAAGATAVVSTGVALGATMAFTKLKTLLEPLLKKKKKIKLKKVKTVLHFVPNDDGSCDIIQYSAKGMKVLESGIEKLEQYLRDETDLNSFYEFDYKLIIDDDLQKHFTKEGTKRFKRHFASPAQIAKKLGSKFAF